MGRITLRRYAQEYGASAIIVSDARDDLLKCHQPHPQLSLECKREVGVRLCDSAESYYSTLAIHG
jgi:hypothetical protein